MPLNWKKLPIACRLLLMREEPLQNGILTSGCITKNRLEGSTIWARQDHKTSENLL